VVTGGKQTLDWQNSVRLESIDAIADLKRGEGPNLIIQGSSTLYPQLLRAGLIDRLTLMTFPLILGSGKR
jgi:dihydrofolate reductase